MRERSIAYDAEAPFHFLHQLATEDDDVRIIGFSEPARRARTYKEYLSRISKIPAAEIEYVGLALYGPFHTFKKLTGELKLLY